MPSSAATPGDRPFVVTLVVDLPVGKLDALDVIAFVADGEVVGAGTAAPRVPLGSRSWAEVEIPRFGDPPPLAVDVFSTVSLEDARHESLRLRAALEAVGWTVRDPRSGEA
ncbi:hypothetical protein DVJ78_01595 [Humibacter sp. BT305]|uniref:Uncharacterized protein n=1 Tax=Cnuibacter physcomitrellae TaxID=1619308 RepID=A0A1X9LJ90_9MICO|nr:hypothetical protein [Cnuibacter physcomitrellae]ARJ03981.1 hypothetical protein B5808_01065 [Cnuibacter physcomitrellae]AXH34287.1 hypothetical protein DVJ78_01595 [Humibacter sp. BT305]GGI39947.1 hypothetical protein GCM10010988_26630 [Cnuibacter physcomitrellae]